MARHCEKHLDLPPPLARSNQESSACTSPESRIGLAVVDPGKGRFSYPHSSVVFPRKLGQEMNLQEDLKFHSYGWNLSLRQEPRVTVRPAVRRYLTFQDVSLYGQVYFKVVDPVYHFIDHGRFFDRCAKYWLSEKPDMEDIEALISGVVALGSFFATEPCQVENQLMQHAKEILDTGCAYAPGRLSLDQAAAWVLRTLYLRLTTRPHLSWYASCSAVHVVEAMGLHVDFEAVDLAADSSSALATEFIASRRCIFECATFLNAIISAEYGRSRVLLQGLKLSSKDDERNFSKTMSGQLTQLLVSVEEEAGPHTTMQILQSICDLPDQPPTLVLLKTDIALHLYRKTVNNRHKKFSDVESQVMISIIKTALSVARQFLPDRQPWWNVLSTPFQSLLILIAMDSNESLDLVPDAMSVLTAVYETFKTHLVVEVIKIAKCLIEGLEKRKIKQTGFLSRASDLAGIPEDLSTWIQGPVTAEQGQTLCEDWIGDEPDWDFMFEGDVLSNYASGTVSNFP
ncbi:hypothetical protein MMC08_000663 [Hypocenomyce scalaris]|nr:hypothetical protein [Hypocenomyce scalaris]